MSERGYDSEAGGTLTSGEEGPESGVGELPPPLRHLSSYQVLEPLGDGGMGVVYRALDLERQTFVALKTLRRMSPISFARLKAEFRAVADVAHPNLVSLHELLIEDGIPFFTMELVEGTDFLSYVRGHEQEVGRPEDRHLDEAGIARLRDALGQLALGVIAVHDAGKVHRDLKRNNVMVTHGGRVVLLDFGLAVDQRGDDGEEPLVGTPAYMAPEQLRGDPVTGAADWFAVGVMLYRALTGAMPVGHTTEERLATEDLVPPAPSILSDAVPGDLDHLCMALLQSDPDARPSDADVLARLRLQPPAPISRADGDWRRVPSKLVGRGDLLTALDEALGRAVAGDTAIVRMLGASGVGKTALVRSWLAQVGHDQRALVLTSRCRERESFPYKAFDGLIDGVVGYLRSCDIAERIELLPDGMAELARLFPALRTWTAQPSVSLDRQQQRSQAFHCLKELFTRMARRAPLVLWIDDLQWMDADSVAMLNELFAAPAPSPLLLVCTARDEELPPRSVTPRDSSLPPPSRSSAPPPWTVASWRPPAEVTELAVAPLPDSDAVELAGALSSPDDVGHDQLETIARESLGNPFLIEQMVHHVSAGGDALSLDAVVLARLQTLPADARRILDVVAVAGHPLQQSIVLAVAQPTGDAWSAIALLRGSNLITTHGARGSDLVETWHDRIRKSVVEQLSHAERARYRGSIARALEPLADVDSAQLAAHFHAAGQRDKAGVFALRAAEQAMAALAFDRAAELFQLALDCDAAARHILLEARALALVDAGRCSEAAPLYREAAMGRPREKSLELRRLAAEQLMVSGRLDEGLRELEPVLDSLDVTYPRSTPHAILSVVWQYAKLKVRGLEFVPTPEEHVDRVLLQQIDLAWSAVKGLLSYDSMMGAHFLLITLHRALQAGEPFRVSRALMTLGMATVFQGDTKSHTDGMRIIERGARAAPEGDHYLEGLLAICRGTADMSVGSWRQGLSDMERGIQVLERHCINVRWECSAARSSCLNTLFWLGDVAEIARRAAAWQRDGERVGDLFTVVTAELYCAYAALAADDPEGARQRVRNAMKRWAQSGFHYQHWLAKKIQIWCDLYEGRISAAQRRLAACVGPLHRSGLLRVQLMAFDALLLRGRVTVAGAPAEADLAQTLRHARKLENMGRPATRAGGALLRALVGHARGKRSATRSLASAGALFADADVATFSLAARRRAAEGGGRTDELKAIDDELLRSGVAAPARWCSLFA